MQLSSALISAAALLAQVASGFYLSVGEEKDNFATHQNERIGFYDPPGDQLAFFDLDEAGDLVSGDGMSIAFFDRGDGLWRLESLPSTEGSDGRPAMRGPFAIEGDRLVYQGEDFVWYLCGKPDALDLSLAPRVFDYDPSQEECHAGAAIFVF